MIKNLNIKNNPGFIVLALRLVIGWTYFSAFWRRVALNYKLDPDSAGYIGEKFNHFLPNALGIKPLIQYLVENPDILWWNMVLFTIIEGIVGLFLMFGLFTRLMSIGIFMLAMGILLGSGWIGTTCLDEWQIGILGIAGGFVLFLTGSSHFSLDHYLIRKEYKFTTKKWFSWLGSGILPVRERFYSLFVLGFSLFIFGITLLTNQVFHGGVWGTLHNKSIKPKLEITNTKIQENELSFDVYRTEGVDVYGSWTIDIRLLNQKREVIVNYGQEELSKLTKTNISNYYVSKIKPGKHSLIIPLGAKANIKLFAEEFRHLSKGKYIVEITDISGIKWSKEILVD